MNKTEAAWLDELIRIGYTRIRFSAITFKLGHDCRYTPDFICFTRSGQMIAWEVKGFRRDDAMVKLRVAATVFPEVEFILVELKKSIWVRTYISPIPL